MNLSQIKNKYKQILQQSESDNSDQEWSLAYSKIDKKRKKHLLTQISYANRINTSTNDDSILLKTKQKLAQSIANLAKKDQQLIQIKQENINILENNQNLHKQIENLTICLEDRQKQINQQKIAYQCLQKQLKNLQKIIQTNFIDKQLLQQQIQYYYKQVQQSKNKAINHKKQFDNICKNLENMEKIKNQNQRLKQDIKRLNYILDQQQRYKKLPKLIHNCHFLGKPQKQADSWFSQDLIGQSQHFLKKQQIGYGNRQFLNNLIKFIDKQIKRSNKQITNKIKRIQTSRRKDLQRKQNQSLCMHDIMNHNSLGKSQLAYSYLRGSRKTSMLNDSKRCTESFIYEKLEKSLAAHQVHQGKKFCIQLFQQFKRTIIDLLSQRQPKKKKIIKLINWVCESVLELLSSHFSNGSKIKITQ